MALHYLPARFFFLSIWFHVEAIDDWNTGKKFVVEWHYIYFMAFKYFCPDACLCHVMCSRIPL